MDVYFQREVIYNLLKQNRDGAYLHEAVQQALCEERDAHSDGRSRRRW